MHRAIALLILANIACSGGLGAQVLLRSSVIGGGSTAAAGGGVVIAGTIGQPIVGRSASEKVVSQGFWYTRLSLSGVSGVEGGESSPAGYALGQNYPNPFSVSTAIPITLAAAGHVTLRLYDLFGRVVRTLMDEERGPGVFLARVDGEGLRSGRYIASIECGGVRKVLPLIVAK